MSTGVFVANENECCQRRSADPCSSTRQLR